MSAVFFCVQRTSQPVQWAARSSPAGSSVARRLMGVVWCVPEDRRIVLPTQPRNPRRADDSKGGSKRVSDTLLTKTVFDALRGAQPLSHALFGVKTLSGTLLGPAFQHASGYGARLGSLRRDRARARRGPGEQQEVERKSAARRRTAPGIPEADEGNTRDPRKSAVWCRSTSWVSASYCVLDDVWLERVFPRFWSASGGVLVG